MFGCLEGFLPRDSPSLYIGSHFNRIVTWSFLFFSGSIVLFSVMRATGAAAVPLLVNGVTLLAVRYQLGLLLFYFWCADGIRWSFLTNGGIAVIGHFWPQKHLDR